MKELLQTEQDQWSKSAAVWRGSLPLCFKAALAGALLCYSVLIVYGYNSPDTIMEGTFFYVSVHWQEACGRWVIRLLSDLGGSVVMPAVSVAFNALCCAFAAALLAEWWQVTQKWAQVLLSLALVVCPTMVRLSLYVYSYYTEGFCIAIFTLAAYLLFTKRGVSAGVGSVVALCLGMATYQCDLGITVGLIMMGLMFYCLEQRSMREIAHMAGRALGAGVLGFLLYYASIHLWSAWQQIPLAKRGGLSTMTPLSLLAGVPARLRGCYHLFKEYFYILGTNHLGKILLCCLLCAAALLGVGAVKLALHKKPQVLLLAVLGALLPVGCCLINLATEFEFNLNTSMSMQFVVLFAIALAARSRPLIFAGVWPARAAQLVTGAAAALLCWVCCYTAYATYYTIGLAYRATDTLATGVINRVQAAPEYTADTRVLIAGLPDEAASQKFNLLRERSLYDDDMVLWRSGDGITGGWMHYLYDYHGFYTGEVALNEYYTITDSAAFAAMPLYPAEGSLALFGDILVVKLQDDLPR